MCIVDWKIKYLGDDYPLLHQYPFIIGSDCAGEVIDVGPDVTRFKKGDRVTG